MSDNFYATCASENANASASALLECVSGKFQSRDTQREADLVRFLFVLTGAMVFFMQAGFAMLCAGAVRLKNVQNTMLKNLLDACGSAVAWYLVGKLSTIVDQGRS